MVLDGFSETIAVVSGVFGRRNSRAWAARAVGDEFRPPAELQWTEPVRQNRTELTRTELTRTDPI